MKKVALYCRVSSDEQKERQTIQNQVEILESYLDFKEGLEIHNKYLDDGVSGTIPLYERTEGSRMMADAKKGLFKAVLVWKIDRFGRDTLSGLTTSEMLTKEGIEIISVTEPFDLTTPTGRYQFINYLNMAELERNNILDRMFMGATRAAKQGKWMGGITPYGYTVNAKGYLEITQQEAEIIQKIFSLYVDDKMSTMDIAIYLNNLGIPSSCGSSKGKRTKNITGKWRSGSIQRILSNTTYKGIHEYGKRATRRKETILREVPAIVDNEIWEKAQIQKKENAIMSKRNTKVREYLLRGLIKCNICGKTYYGISYKDKNSVYACSGKRGENKKLLGIKCDNLNLNAEMIEDYIWRECLHIVKHYDTYVQNLKNNSNNTPNNNENKINLQKLKKSLVDKKSEKNNILTLFRKNIISEDDVEEQLEDIKKEEKKILDLISSLKNRLSNYEHEDKLITNMSNKLEMYYNKLNNLTFSDKYDIVRLLVKSIMVSYIIEDGIKIPNMHIIFNLVKLETYTDMDSWLQLT